MIASEYNELQFEQKEENGENKEQETSLVAGDRERKDSSTSRVAKKASWTIQRTNLWHEAKHAFLCSKQDLPLGF